MLEDFKGFLVAGFLGPTVRIEDRLGRALVEESWQTFEADL